MIILFYPPISCFTGSLVLFKMDLKASCVCGCELGLCDWEQDLLTGCSEHRTLIHYQLGDCQLPNDWVP